MTATELFTAQAQIAGLLFIVTSMLGMGMSLTMSQVRRVMGLGTAQRNVSAAILVSAQNFAGTMTLPYCCCWSSCLLRSAWESAVTLLLCNLLLQISHPLLNT